MVDTMAGPSSEVSFLLEYQHSRRCLTTRRLNDVPGTIKRSLRESFETDISLKYSKIPCDEDEDYPEELEVQGRYMIQRWSDKFNCFVDVVCLREIRSGDRLTVVSCPTITTSVNTYVH